VAFVGFGKPGETELKRFVQVQRTQPVTYRGALAARAGFTFGRTLEPLGDGPEVFARAVAGLQAWAVYPAWLTLYPSPASVRDGVVVALVTGASPIWTVSAVRVVAVERAPQRFSFTLGTLPQHAVSGLERFSVFQDEFDTVWYEITAVSKPRGPLVKLGVPVLRLVQRRFARDSVRSLRRSLAQPCSS
jgi:uncharacterized protein (UPF0548 family)